MGERVLSVVQGERGAKEEGPKPARRATFTKAGRRPRRRRGRRRTGSAPPCGPGGRGARGVWCERSAWCKASVVRGEHGVRRAAAWCNDGRDERVLSVVQGERGAKEEGPKPARRATFTKAGRRPR